MYSDIMVQKLRLFIFLFVAIITLSLFSGQAYAVQFKQANNLVLSQDNKIDETIFAAGNNVTIDSDINGDLFCGGQSVTINGSINGDIICAAQNLKINGKVNGNVRVAAQTVDINGTVARNLNVIAQSVTLAQKSSVKGDIIFGAQTIDLSGVGGRDLSGIGQSITITGSLLRNALINVNDLNITGKARIKGDLEYLISAQGTATIGANSVVGKVSKYQIPVKRAPIVEPHQIKPLPYSAILTTSLLGAIAFFIIACAFIYFDKERTERITNTIQEKPVVSFFVGLAVLVTFPFAFFLLLITFIGVPLAFIALFVYIAALIGASTYSSIVIGWNLLKLVKKTKKPSPTLSALVGTITLAVLITTPAIGWLFGILAMLAGLGSFFASYLPEKA